MLAASSAQAAPLIDQCVDIVSVLDAMSEVNTQWFEVIPEDLMHIWPVVLHPDSVCGTSDKRCLQYESSRAVRLDDGSPLCRASFNWSATHADPILHSIILWSSTLKRAEAVEMAERMRAILQVPDDAIASGTTDTGGSRQRYQWERRDGGRLLEVSVLSIDLDRVGPIWRSFIVVGRERIEQEQ